MGAENSKLFEFSEQEILQKYDVIQRITDPRAGQIRVLQDRETKEELILREMNYSDQTEVRKNFEQLEKRKTIGGDNLVQLYQFFFRSEEQFCSQFFRTYLVFQYCPNNLEKDINTRALKQNYYHEHEIWNIVKGVINGMAVMQSHLINHQNIRPQTIYLTSENQIKLVQPIFFNQSTLFTSLFNMTSGGERNCYIDPILLFSSEDCYKLKAPQQLMFDLTILENKKAAVASKYSSKLTSIISLMLEIEENLRPDFLELQQYLVSYQLPSFPSNQPSPILHPVPSATHFHSNTPSRSPSPMAHQFPSEELNLVDITSGMDQKSPGNANIKSTDRNHLLNINNLNLKQKEALKGIKISHPPNRELIINSNLNNSREQEQIPGKSPKTEQFQADQYLLQSPQEQQKLNIPHESDQKLKLPAIRNEELFYPIKLLKNDKGISLAQNQTDDPNRSFLRDLESRSLQDSQHFQQENQNFRHQKVSEQSSGKTGSLFYHTDSSPISENQSNKNAVNSYFQDPNQPNKFVYQNNLRKERSVTSNELSSSNLIANQVFDYQIQEKAPGLSISRTYQQVVPNMKAYNPSPPKDKLNAIQNRTLFNSPGRRINTENISFKIQKSPQSQNNGIPNSTTKEEYDPFQFIIPKPQLNQNYRTPEKQSPERLMPTAPIVHDKIQTSELQNGMQSNLKEPYVRRSNTQYKINTSDIYDRIQSKPIQTYSNITQIHPLYQNSIEIQPMIIPKNSPPHSPNRFQQDYPFKLQRETEFISNVPQNYHISNPSPALVSNIPLNQPTQFININTNIPQSGFHKINSPIHIKNQTIPNFSPITHQIIENRESPVKQIRYPSPPIVVERIHTYIPQINTTNIHNAPSPIQTLNASTPKQYNPQSHLIQMPQQMVRTFTPDRVFVPVRQNNYPPLPTNTNKPHSNVPYNPNNQTIEYQSNIPLNLSSNFFSNNRTGSVDNYNSIENFNSAQKEQIKKENVIEHFSNGSQYEGTQANGKRNGFGQFFYNDGGRYEGEWVDNQMHGQGTLFYQSGRPAYTGSWKNDQFSGKGILNNQGAVELRKPFDFTDFDYIQEYWTQYEGQFVEDFQHGLGTLYLSNGERYSGEFQNDYIEGFGRFFLSNGRTVEGKWNQNKMVS